MTLTPFQKRLLLLSASAAMSLLAQMFPHYHSLISSMAALALGVTIPGPDTNHTVTVQTILPSVPPTVVSSSDGEAR